MQIVRHVYIRDSSHSLYAIKRRDSGSMPSIKRKTLARVLPRSYMLKHDGFGHFLVSL